MIGRPRSDRNWFGYVTIENILEIGEILNERLEGRRYTFVASRESIRARELPRIDVRTGQRLEARKTYSGKALSSYWDGDDEGKTLDQARFAGIHFADTYGVWGLSTSSHEDWTWEQHHEKNTPYISFDWNKIEIQQTAGCGDRLIWVIAIEPEYRGDDE